MSSDTVPNKNLKDFAMYCYLDFDLHGYRSKLATAAAFVSATDSRYGFSSSDLRLLGGSELSRIVDLITTDHDWSSSSSSGGVEIRPPMYGNRIVLRLFWDVAPLACENFALLCSNGASSKQSIMSGSNNNKKIPPVPIGESGKPLTYRGSVVHRVVPGFIVQGGDFIFGNGSGGESVFNGKKFKDERPGLNLKHDRRGVLSMGNSGKNSNSSQWFITFQAVPQCDGKHVVFGEVVSGWEVLDAVEKLGTSSGEPSGSIVVTDCGIWTPLVTPGAGYWYDQPDPESYTGISSVFMVRPRVAVVVPSEVVYAKFVMVLGNFCVTQAVCADHQFDNNEAAQANQIVELLANFAVDVVLVAPASKGVIEHIRLPLSWTGDDVFRSGPSISLDDVVIESKPVEALTLVHSRSWLVQATSWILDGKS